MFKRNNRKGFTIVEILVVIVVIGILAKSLMPKMSQTVHNSNIDSAEIDLRVFSLDFNSYFIDYGKITIPSTLDDTTYTNLAKETMNNLSRQYLSFSLDLDNTIIDKTKNIITADTIIQKDPWGNYYKIFISTESGVIIVASAGPNTMFENSTYSEGNFGDDIIVVIEPK